MYKVHLSRSKAFYLAVSLMAILMILAGCGKQGASSGDAKTTADASGQTAVPPTGSADAASTALSGTVVETMDAGRYTYILVRTADKDVWVAGPLTAIAVGEEVHLPPGMEMKNFTSPALERTFETVYFVQSFSSADAGAADPHAGIGTGSDNSRTAAGRTAVGAVEKAPGGFTVAEIYARKSELNGKTVTVRGVVVKFSPAIMGKNWIHLQDGTGSDDSSDLTVTTDAKASVGEQILVEGTLAVDKDFGSGYRYVVIVEDARLLSD